MENRRISQVSIRSLRFSAKVDYITVHAPGKQPLPATSGSAVWARSKGNRFVSIHDLEPADVGVLTHALNNPRVSELEVSIDIACGPEVEQDQRLDTLRSVMVDLFGRKLYPRGAALMREAARCVYRRHPAGYQIGPFNLRLPEATDQQLHGFRFDHAQVKAYLKTTDNRRRLPEHQWRARVEVRLSGEGLAQHGIEHLHDLRGFKFRRELSPYFRFVRAARLRGLDRAPTTHLHTVLMDKMQDASDREWDRCGVGAVEHGGKAAHKAHRLLRDQEVNDRVGQALGRLEQAFRRAKFVREPAGPDPPIAGLARVLAVPRQSSMTY